MDTHNEYGEIATHEDCGNYHQGGCEGVMEYWENPNTGNTRLFCGQHANEADDRQNRIHNLYLNDSVFSEDY